MDRYIALLRTARFVLLSPLVFLVAAASVAEEEGQ